ncbi:MAG: histone deacetylase family protein, partial [Alphaproteobacteria bacterium]|nr:histone deacetylase family protein [Alphaproteobacteria bacterium]
SICAARRQDGDFLNAVHDSAYLAFLRGGFERWREIPGTGPELMPSLRPTIAHLPFSTHVLAEAGRFMMDFSCPIVAETWKAAEASAMTAATAADLVLKGETVAYALCRPPGHHAYGNRASGFCYLNNSAIAAERLRSTHERVAILDIDIHHGNGTQAIFYHRPDVLTVSVHADPAQYYPFYWGSAEEAGEDEGEGFNLNLPMPFGSDDDTWLEAIDRGLDRIEAFAPGALVVALGLDAHEMDPLQGARVTQGGFARAARRIAGLGLPTVIVQEGGYLTEHLPDNLAIFLSTFEGALELSVNGATA